VSDPYYCKLYVDTDEDEGSLEAALVLAVGEAFGDIVVEYPIYRNEILRPQLASETVLRICRLLTLLR